MPVSLADIVGSVSPGYHVELLGDPGTLIARLSSLEVAASDSLSFLSHPKYLAKLAGSTAGCVVVSPAAREDAQRRGACIVVEDPYHYFALITQFWKRRFTPPIVPFIHPTAFVDPTAQLALDVCIGAFACISAGAVVAAGARIGAHCVIGERAHIGADTHLAAHVTVGDDCHVGQRCILHPGAVLGADGFGFAPHQGRWVKIEQLGAVLVGDDCEIGANTCIDRGALQNTVLDDGVKLDNLVQIGHNVYIGKHTAMAGCVGVAGSAVIGAHCTVGGGAIVLGHLTLADHVHISAASVVTRSILKPGQYSGLFPIDDNAAWEKNAATLKQLHALRDRLKAVEKTLSQRVSLQSPGS
ncbi:MAG: UDP-3-O-(3-hydroxymyristoyl)glucosamine N-acyltransferase [Polaromonas sp.]|nr:UDP-3-O-(3-hydroxymyristoyl)glucosamine N-acyltransferase [Polaromonas sp.]